MFLPSLCLIGLRLQFVDFLAESIDFVTARLLVLVRSNEGGEFVINLSNRLAGHLKSILRGLALFALKSVDFYLELELELPTLQFIDSFESSFASHADTERARFRVRMEPQKIWHEGKKTHLAHASSTKSIAESGSRRAVR